MLKGEDSASDAEPQRPAQQASGYEPSHIAGDTQVTGNLKSSGNIRVEGRVNGEVHAQAVDITPGAFIDGSVKAQVIQVGGKVKGRVEAKQIIIQKSGEMFGDVIYEKLEVEAGSTFEGACKPWGSEPKVEQEVGDSSKVA